MEVADRRCQGLFDFAPVAYFLLDHNSAIEEVNFTACRMDFSHDPKDLAIVNTIITMARELGLEFLAEGMENEGQLESLRQQGCALIQGFHFAKPMPVAECARWCETSSD